MAKRTKIEGVTITPLQQIVDDRGAVLHMLRNDSEDFTGFGECYFSEIFTGAVKAWKLHEKQTQLLSVPVGKVRFVLYDDRAGSPSKGEAEIVELGRPDDYSRIRIPPGIWYGFTCISDTNALIVNCADLPFDQSERRSRPPKDPEIPYEW